jgi:hypothetical protein
MSDPNDEPENVNLDLGEDIPAINIPLPPHQPAPDAVNNFNDRKRFSRENCEAVGPIYYQISEEQQQSINYTSTITSARMTSEGEIFASQLSYSAPADETDVETFIMWTSQRAIEPETANADFASTCNWTFGYIKGTSANLTMVIVIGQLFADETKPSPAKGRYTFLTPPFYLIPTGLNRDSAKFLLADFEALGSNEAAKCHMGKRQRVQLPSTIRASITNQGESSINLEDLNGNYHHTRERKEVSKREKELAPIWRLTKGREMEVMGKDCILQVKEYKQHIMEESISQIRDPKSEYSDSSLVRQILDHPVVKEDKCLRMFLRANFGSDPTTSISFSSFLPRKTTPGNMPTYSARCDYSQAAASLEIAARVFLSKEFSRVMDPVLLLLNGPQDILSLVADDFLLWTIERTFSKWGKTVRTESISTVFPTISLDTPTGCAQLLTAMLTADLQLLSGESLFIQERFYRTTTTAHASNAMPTVKPTTVTEGGKIAPELHHCRFHLAHVLNAKCADGSKIPPCNRGKDCRATHSAINTITKEMALAMASKFNSTLRDSVTVRIEEMSTRFKK